MPDPDEQINQPNETQDVSPWRIAWERGSTAAIQYRMPALVLWIFGIAIVSGYFYVGPITNVLDSIGQIKTDFGWKFSVASTAIFGGLIPAIIPWCLAKSKQQLTLGYLLSNSIFWGFKGFEIDSFYLIQNWVFGNQFDLTTIFLKSSVDQLVYAPTFGLVSVVLFYLWRDCHFSIGEFRKQLGRHWYRQRVLPLLISNWAVWIPAVALIYCLPLALQIPVQNLILCFWVLVISVFSDSPSDPKSTESHERS